MCKLSSSRPRPKVCIVVFTNKRHYWQGDNREETLKEGARIGFNIPEGEEKSTQEQEAQTWTARVRREAEKMKDEEEGEPESKKQR